MLAKKLLAENLSWLAIPMGILLTLLLTAAFVAYQRWRFSIYDEAVIPPRPRD